MLSQVDYIKARGGEVILNAPVREIMLHREFRENVVDGFRLPNVSPCDHYSISLMMIMIDSFQVFGFSDSTPLLSAGAGDHAAPRVPRECRRRIPPPQRESF
jgi:hypothetical protein